jgi:hypothetical protein
MKDPPLLQDHHLDQNQGLGLNLHHLLGVQEVHLGLEIEKNHLGIIIEGDPVHILEIEKNREEEDD